MRSETYEPDTECHQAVALVAEPAGTATVAPAAAREMSGLWQETLDSLSAHVAVLDDDGVIIAVNAAWQRFADTEGASGDAIGTDYIWICESARDPMAAQVAKALREILAGERDMFELDYPCHSALEERWFRLRATRCSGATPARVVVAHERLGIPPVRAGALAADEARDALLLHAQSCLHAVTESMADGLLTIDVDGRVGYINQAAQSVLGWTLEEVVGRPISETVYAHTLPNPPPAPARLGSCPLAGAVRQRETVRVEDDRLICRDGSELPVAYTVSPLVADTGPAGCVLVFQDMTAHRADAARREQELDRLTWLGRLKDAVADRRLVLHAQPIVELATRRVAQHELLIRMAAPASSGAGTELVAPGRFLPIAEEYGFISEIDRWVVDRAAEIACAGSPVELNVSARSISERLFVDHVYAALARTGAAPDRLVFEITETAFISDIRAATAFVEQVHALGCKIALDDFGTGYGSLTYLKQLPIDLLKIDIEFVRDLRHNHASRNVVQAVINLAEAFNMETVAEGVEDEETLHILGELGADFAQGFLLGRPGPLAGPLSAT